LIDKLHECEFCPVFAVLLPLALRAGVVEVLLFTELDVDEDELLVEDVEMGELNEATLLLKPGGAAMCCDCLRLCFCRRSLFK